MVDSQRSAWERSESCRNEVHRPLESLALQREVFVFTFSEDSPCRAVREVLIGWWSESQ